MSRTCRLWAVPQGHTRVGPNTLQLPAWFGIVSNDMQVLLSVAAGTEVHVRLMFVHV